MSTSIDQLPLSQILTNLSSLEQDFAITLITQSFKGFQQALLLRYAQGKITEEEVSTQWDSVPYSGILSLDAKISSLSVIDRLTLLAITLKQLGITTNHLDFLYETSTIDIQALVGTLTLLMSDLVNKDHLKIKRKDTQLILIESLLPETITDLEEQCDEVIIGAWISEDENEDKEKENTTRKPTMDDIFF